MYCSAIPTVFLYLLAALNILLNRRCWFVHYLRTVLLHIMNVLLRVCSQVLYLAVDVYSEIGSNIGPCFFEILFS